MTLSKNIIKRRQKKHWSQRELARRSGVSLRGLKNIELEKSSPTLRTIDAIAEALGTNARTLLS